MPTFYDRFVECAERWPSQVALELQRHEQIESCTYSELRRMAESVGRWVTEQGFARGSRLAIFADNHPRWVATYLGVIASGLTAVPLDTALHADQVTKLLKDSGTSLLATDVKHLATAQPAITGLEIELILTDPGSLKAASPKIKTDPGQARWVGDLDAIFTAGPGNFHAVEAPA